MAETPSCSASLRTVRPSRPSRSMISSEVRRISACDSRPRGVAGLVLAGLLVFDFADLAGVLLDEPGMMSVAGVRRISPMMNGGDRSHARKHGHGFDRPRRTL
ncbi:protein of unknown function [Sterolibacterium denitrificans]|uniref:Uncharacterized protein n=1 Tax=Sterolibacterium denitrificans TaxID=157592 RepID=A0A7Z7HPV0_9PROT|nr:protein of unknown function [Sterolibacterium denitrificans]